MSESMKKANKRLYFLVMLKRAGVPLKGIVAFYTTAIKPVLEYCSPVFHHALPKYLCNDIERVQKRALSIIMPNNSYEASLVNFNLTTLQARREQQCFKLFDSISGDHKLSGLVPLPSSLIRKQGPEIRTLAFCSSEIVEKIFHLSSESKGPNIGPLHFASLK